MVRLWEAGSYGKGHHATRHAHTTEHEQLPATESINGEEGDKAGEEFPGEGAAAEGARRFGIHAKALLKDDLEMVSIFAKLEWSRRS